MVSVRFGIVFLIVLRVVEALVGYGVLLFLFKVLTSKQPSKLFKRVLFTILLVFFVAVNLELYFKPYPLIDTHFPAEFNLAKFRQIKPGTPRNEVEGIIGKGNGPKGPFSIIPDKGESCEQYSRDGRNILYDFAWMGMGVCYGENNRVTRIYEVPVFN